jgi:hypothetical protein
MFPTSQLSKSFVVELGSAAVVGKGGPWKFTRRARILFGNRARSVSP